MNTQGLTMQLKINKQVILQTKMVYSDYVFSHFLFRANSIFRIGFLNFHEYFPTFILYVCSHKQCQFYILTNLYKTINKCYGKQLCTTFSLHSMLCFLNLSPVLSFSEACGISLQVGPTSFLSLLLLKDSCFQFLAIANSTTTKFLFFPKKNRKRERKRLNIRNRSMDLRQLRSSRSAASKLETI